MLKDFLWEFGDLRNGWKKMVDFFFSPKLPFEFALSTGIVFFFSGGAMLYDDGLKTAIPYANLPKNNRDVKNFCTDRSAIERTFGLVSRRFKFISTPRLVNSKKKKSMRKHSMYILACLFFYTLEHQQKNRLNEQRCLPHQISAVNAPEVYKLFKKS